jgi:hypothetical protein
VKLAVVVGGWHWPLDFFTKMAAQASGADLFVVAHRNPQLPIVREEKREILEKAPAVLGELDRKLYRAYPTIVQLRTMGWHYQEEPNTVGDWGFFNQWLVQHDWRRYDAILNCHDDNWIRRDHFVSCLMLKLQMSPETLLISNGRYPEAPAGYVRGSFEVWSKELLMAMNGKIDLGPIGLTREGLMDSPAELDALSAWNDTAVPLRRFMVDRGLQDRIGYLSPHYRISPWVIEGERGFIHYQGGAPWSFEAGLKAFPIQESELV